MAKLLLLDDDEHALTWMSAALEDQGHEVATFTSAREALTYLERSTPDLIVADILMPELDGIAFAALVRRRRDVPLMFVSIARKRAEAVLVGAIGYVQKPATAEEIRAAVERILGERTRRNTVLVVDDDPDVCALYHDFLESRFEVLSATSGKEALEVLRSRRVDLAIVDVHMPIMNGAELIRAIRADPSLEGLPIVVQTSDHGAIRMPIWGSLGVSKVMSKPSFIAWFDAKIDAARDVESKR